MEVVGTIASAITIAAAIKAGHAAFGKISDLPKAFDAVQDELPLVSRLLTQANAKLAKGKQPLLNDEENKSLEAIAKRCKAKLERMKGIYDELEKKRGTDPQATSWPKLRAAYLKALKGKKAHRVESLMADVMKDVKLLLLETACGLATEKDIKDIQRAIEVLSTVEPSLDDSEFESSSLIHASQTISDHATGNQLNMQGMDNKGPIAFGNTGGTHNYGDGHHHYYETIFQTGYDDRQSPSRSTPRASPCFNVPFDSDPDFIRRTDILEWLDQQYEGPTNRMALVGWGGYGKSQLAIHFAHWYHERFPEKSVFWVNASSKTSFKQSYKSMANLLGLPRRNDLSVDTLQLVKDWLQGEQSGSWLMILDNADDGKVFFSERIAKYEKYLPIRNNGTILVTSRNKEVALKLMNNNGHYVKEISTMTEQQSMELFRKKTKAAFPESDIQKLLEALGHIPLAISQAAAYLNHNHSQTPATYLRFFQKSDRSKESLLNKDFGDLRRDKSVSNSVVVTWQVTFNKIRRQKPSAADLLSFMSCFEPQGIPVFVLKETWRQNDMDATTAGDPDAHPDSRFEEDVGVLVNYSLTSMSSDHSVCDMHPLVRYCTSIWLSKSSWLNRLPIVKLRTLKEKWTQAFLMAMERAFPDWKEAGTSRSIGMLLPHIESIVQEKPAARDLQCWARLLSNYAGYLNCMWDHEAAARYCETAVDTMKGVVGEEHYETRRSMLLQGHILLSSGRYEEAEPVLRFGFEIEEREFTRKWQQLKDERGERGEEEYLMTLQLLRIQFNHAIIQLASGYLHQGRPREAQELLEKSLYDTDIGLEKLFGSEDQVTLMFKASLSRAYLGQGRLDEAEALALQAVETGSQAFGENRVGFVFSLVSLSEIYLEQRRWKEAEEVVAHLLELGKNQTRQSSLLIMRTLALTQIKQKCIQGLELVQECHRLAYEALGLDHPFTIETAKWEDGWRRKYLEEGELWWSKSGGSVSE